MKFERIEHTSLAGAIGEVYESTTVLLATAWVDIQVGLFMYPCRALCDSGAQMNLITKECADKLGAKSFGCNQMVRGLGSPDGVAIKKRVRLKLCSRLTGAHVLTAEFAVMSDILGTLPNAEFPKIHVPDNVTLADPEYNSPGRIDLLFGAGIWAQMVNSTIYRNPMGTILQGTSFGFVVLGRCASDQARAMAIARINTLELVQQRPGPSNEEITDLLRKFWEIQEFGGARIRGPQEQLAEDIFVQSITAGMMAGMSCEYRYGLTTNHWAIHEQ